MGAGKERNNACFCGSGKKYKHCCYEVNQSEQQESPNSIINSAMKEASAKECLFLDKDKCSEKIIKAHSIQNNRFLKKISEEGDLIMLRPNVTVSSFEIKEELVGRAKATTFTGFCGYHDNVVFSPIEKNSYEPGNKEQDALFAYRALAKEHHAKLGQYKIAEKYKDISPRAKLTLIGAGAALKDIDHYLEIFKKILLKKEFGLLETKSLMFDGEMGLAVSSAINFNYDFEGNPVNNLLDLESTAVPFFISIFPENGKTYVLLSYFKEHAERYKFLDKQLIEVDEDIAKKRITNLLMINCENIVFSPVFWFDIDEKYRNIYTSKMLKNLREEEMPGDIDVDYGFHLF